MLSLELFDTFILNTKLMQLLIRKEDEKDALRTEKFPIKLAFLLLLKLRVIFIQPITQSIDCDFKKILRACS